MILSENSSLQLAAILIESSEEQGDKQGFIQRAKAFFKRIIGIIVEKIKSFGKFIKEKVRGLFDKIEALKMRLQGFSSDEIEMYQSMRDVARSMEDELKDWYKIDHKEILKAKDTIAKLVSEMEVIMKDMAKVAKDDNVSDEEYNKRTEALVEKMDKLDEAFYIFADGSSAFAVSKRDLDHDRHVTKYKMSIKSAIQALDVLGKTSKECAVVTSDYVSKLNGFKSQLETIQSITIENTRSRIFGVITKLNAFIGKIGSGVNKIWANIFSFVGKIFKSFGKKKEEDK